MKKTHALLARSRSPFRWSSAAARSRRFTRTNVQIPVPDALPRIRRSSRPAKSPPESGPPRETPFPKIEHQDLPSGLALDVVQARTLPLVQIRVLVKSGAAADGDNTGPRQLHRQDAEGRRRRSLFEQGSAGQDRDARRRSRRRGRPRQHGALARRVPRLISTRPWTCSGAVTREPRWDEQEFGKLKKRQVKSRPTRPSRTAPGARRCSLWQRALPTAHRRPSLRFVRRAGRAELAEITTALCRDFYKKNFTPKITTIIVGGDIDVDASAQSGRARRSAAGRSRGRRVDASPRRTPPSDSRSSRRPPQRARRATFTCGMLGPVAQRTIRGLR